MKARERNGESASAARDGRSWNTANDAAVDLPCESVSTLVAMVTGGRARARSDCWRRDETVCFSARASRGSVAFITSGFPRAPRSTPLQSLRAESRTDIRRPGLSRTPEPTSNETKLAKRRDIFAAPLGRGGSHCPPRFGRGSSPPTRRDGVEVGSETRDRGVRRGDARRRRRQRARAPGRSHREQVRRACVTKYTARRIEPARTDVARDRSRRTPTRATRAGGRAGCYAGDTDLVQYLREVRKHGGLMVPGPVQAAAVAAFDDQQHVDVQREIYRERLELGLALLRSAGADVELPRGGFYLWAAAPGGDAWALARTLAERAGVIVSPSEFYGRRADHVRFAAVQSSDDLRTATERLTA